MILDAELTVGIFSFNKPTAKKFLGQIKTELEVNRDLVAVYPETFWANPQRQAPRSLAPAVHAWLAEAGALDLSLLIDDWQFADEASVALITLGWLFTTNAPKAPPKMVINSKGRACKITAIFPPWAI